MAEREPRYLKHVPVDPGGIVPANVLPVPLPYGLTPRDFFRTVEDVHDLLHDLNGLLHQRHYLRLEELLDSAGFSGLLSRTVANRLSHSSRILVVNRFHNGYPDLIQRGHYKYDAVQHGEGGLEIKASRHETNWQTHGPRAGWFGMAQFSIDERADIPLIDLEPTRVVAMLVAEVSMDDWSWQPAAPGKIRSGTATIRSSGIAKLRAGVVWVDPSYRDRNKFLAERAKKFAARPRQRKLPV